jgi:hypothetical protein
MFIVFTKGEIIMNNIYKVIWSKAKNCYVVASEIAKSHTKSASGSEKMGGYGKKALLALAAASAIFCGGLVNVGATVRVNGVTDGANEVYTTTEVNTELGKKANADSVYTKGETYTKDEVNTELGKKANADSVYTKGETYTKDEVNTELGKKANADSVYTKGETYTKDEVNTELGKKANADSVYTKGETYTKDEVNTELGKKADANNVYTKTAADGKFATSDALTTAKTDLEGKITTARNELDGKIAGNTTKITANEKAIQNLNAKAGTTETTLNDLSDRMVVAENNITNLKDKDVELSGNIGANKTAIDQNKTDITQNKNDIANINGKLTTAEGNIQTNTDNINALDKKVGTINNGTYLDGTASVADNLGKLDAGLKQEVADRTAVDNALSGRIDANANTIAEVNQQLVNTNNHFNTELRKTNAALQAEGQDRANADAALANDITATNKRTAGIARNDTTSETTIEKNVTVDNLGNVKAKGDVNAGSLNVTGASDLKGNVTLGTPNGTNTVTVNGTAYFNEVVNMDKGLTVTNGETNLKKTTVDGDLKVTGTITTDTMVFGDKATNNYTEIDKGHITSKNDVLAGDATKKKSSMELDHSKLEVGVTDKDSNGHLTMTADQTFIKNSDLDGKNYSEIVADKDSVTTTVKDEKDNTTSTKSSATEIRNYAKDKDGNKTNNVQTATQNKSWAKDKDGNESSIVQTGKDITNTAQSGTITNDAKNIVNNASENITTTAKTMNTTVTGRATESYGELDTTVKGNETHTVTGTKTENVTGKVTENYKAGQATNVTGDQDITVSGKQTNKIDGNQENIIGGDQTTNVTGTLTDKVGDNTRVTTSTSITDTVGTTTNRKIEDGKITDTAGDSTVTTENGKGTTFAKAGSTAVSTEAGAPTDTNIAGNLITTGRVDANELGVSDKDGANTADLSVEAGEGKGVKASAGNGTTTGTLDVTAEEVSSSVKDADGKGSTFKQRIDAIMMESKNVSIKAEETLTNEAKVITNKASEVINNEAININNTATGIITSKASEIQNQADKLISNKVGENTWENMENGKITTSIKDGAKQNLTQSDAAGTTQSTVDGAKSTVTIQNADGLAGAVTDGTNTSVQNQTASAIATDVKDGAGNENASVANATTSANTIKNGTKANTVISTADGTSFINSEAAAPVTGASGAGTHLNTTIKGNTITTGKVTMDYAEVMKDLGVTGKTTTGSLEVKGESKLTGKVTMESDATVGGKLDVTGKATFGDDVDITKNLSVVGDVTANSYKVGDKTYIDANGIHANNQKITDVADGSISEGSKDAVNGGQLYNVKNDLEGKVNKVGANAAAMANLHPMEFDPDSKWNIAAAIGNYGSETAAALGAFYRPNDDVMVNLSTAFGTGENMVGCGVSVRLGKGGNKLSREESNALKDQVNDLTARMDALLSVLNPNMSKDFPDVPENHWAYEAVSRLAGNDIVQGYPDGEFHGERTMTRYEMAEIIYNALSRGAEAEKELVEEFKPELQAMAASEKATAERAEG